MIHWLKTRIRPDDAIYRNDAWVDTFKWAIWIGIPFGIFQGVIIAAGSVKIGGYVLGVIWALLVVAACIRFRFMAFRLADPVEIDNFWVTSRIPLNGVERFEAHMRRRGYKSWEVYLVQVDGSRKLIPVLRETAPQSKRAKISDPQAAAEATAQLLNERLGRLRSRRT